ncbi:M23 family metallopeptidase [Gilliamella apicola]|uniref:M23 family metallopeptidase n=1 Tax=Gilliamella apicola TaxID=1196095 RepID=UPI0039862AA3
MTLSAVKEWKFPVIINSKKEPLTTNNYYAALMSTSTGFYPVSVTNLMHMGIHFDKTVLKKLGDENERQVHCIADGEVVAYRINDYYQKTNYGDSIAFYSTSFVLVRHLLEMERVEEKPESTEPDTENSSTTEKTAEDNSPASKANDTATSTNSTTDKTDTTSENTPDEAEEEKLPPHQLYFYSLYMHLADTAFYDKNSKTPTPAFWEQDIYRVLADHKELNTVEGLCIRDKADNSKNDSILAVLQVGTKVNLNLNLHDENHNWYAVTSLAEGYSSIPELKSIKHTQGVTQTDILGWIFIGKEMASLEFEILELKAHEKLLSGQSEKINILKKEFKTNWVKSKGLRVRNDKKILSMLPEGTQVKISGNKKAKHFVELIEVIRDGKPTIPLPNEKTKIWFDCLERISRGKNYNEVVVLDTPFPIKAGDLIGHIGHDHTPKISLSQNSTEIKCDTNLHVECFTCDDLPNFIAQTRAEASQLLEKDKTLLGISKQAKLLKSPKDADTDVGQHTEIKVISEDINVKWLQVEITVSTTNKKTVWIENSEEISKNINAEGNITLATDKKAWSEYPLQASEVANNSSIIDTPLLLNINNGVFKTLSHRAVDKDETLWIFIEHALDKNNVPIRGWLAINSEGVKKVSCWDWFDFKLIEEKATTKEFYLDVKKSSSRDNASLEAYKPTLKETLTILDRQYHLDQKKYAKIDAKSFNGIADKPQLSSALSRLLIQSESEWYSEIDAQGKMPKWDAFDSEFNEDAKNVFDYLKEGYKANLDAYINTLKESEQRNVKNGLISLRNTLKTIPDPILNNLSQREHNAYIQLKMLENIVKKWDKEKEKIKKMLWWDDVAKGLAKQNQQNQSEQSKTNTESDTSKDNTSTSTNVTLPATLNLDGQAWFMHPMMLINYFKIKTSPWHEPLKNPQRTRYNSGGHDRPWNGAFGYVRNDGNKAHAGLDIFARIGTPCFACLDGEIVQDTSEGTYGNVIVLKVKGDDLRASRNNYTLEFSSKDKNEIVQADNFDIDSDYFYIRYCHVHDTKKVSGIKVGCKVKAGDHIGYTSDTGNAKDLPNTHLHLEIAMKINNNKTENETNTEIRKLGYKINPAFFVNLNPIDEADQKDAVKNGNKHYKQN